MTSPSRYVNKRTADEIESIASSIRHSLGLGEGDRVSLTHLLETVLPELTDDDFRLEIMEDKECPDVEGLTALNEKIIRLPDRTYQKLRAGDYRARFTAAHELGHLFLHQGHTQHYALRKHADYRTDPEWQANMFAGAFLMPKKAFMLIRTVDEGMDIFSVSAGAVETRAKVLYKRLKPRKKKGRNAMRISP